METHEVSVARISKCNVGEGSATTAVFLSGRATASSSKAGFESGFAAPGSGEGEVATVEEGVVAEVAAATVGGLDDSAPAEEEVLLSSTFLGSTGTLSDKEFVC